MDLKTIFAIIAFLVGLLGFYLYLKDMRRGDTKPHTYTFLIWTITQGIATAAMRHGSSGIVFLSFAIHACLVFVIFILSLRRGYKNIDLIDTICLMAALLAIVVWRQLSSPLLSLIMVTLIDVFGYNFTYRKVWHNPWSETLKTWTGFLVCGIFTLLAITHYNWLTLTYTVTIDIANALLIAICLFRRYVMMPTTNYSKCEACGKRAGMDSSAETSTGSSPMWVPITVTLICKYCGHKKVSEPQMVPSDEVEWDRVNLS